MDSSFNYKTIKHKGLINYIHDKRISIMFVHIKYLMIHTQQNAVNVQILSIEKKYKFL